VLLEEFENSVGNEIGVSDWIAMDQLRIGVFAECTEDRQWIHTQPERARIESPFGTAVAHGFLTLSMLVHFQQGCGAYPSDADSVVNYGLNSVRFIHPVASGERIRTRVTLKDIQVKSDVSWQMTFANITEIEKRMRPAMVAENVMLIFKNNSQGA
jgi:acyl dehydratase